MSVILEDFREDFKRTLSGKSLKNHKKYKFLPAETVK